jgi:hypothetical protein
MDQSRSETWKPDPAAITGQETDQRDANNRWPEGILWRCRLPPHDPTARQEWPELTIRAESAEVAKARYREFYGITGIRGDRDIIAAPL